MKTSALLCAAATAMGLTAPARAATVYSNNFDTENGGVAANNYTGFSGLNVTFPSVDLIRGANCAGGSGGCVDLDGGMAGQLRSNDYSFNAGDVVTWRFSASGSRDPSSPEDEVLYAFYFNQRTAGSFVFSSTFGAYDAGSFDDFGLGEYVTAPFDFTMHDVTFTFTAATSGSFSFVFDEFTGFNDDDGHGRIIDNVSLDISPAPEPATWAMMILGFGAVGLSARRRRSTLAVVPA